MAEAHLKKKIEPYEITVDALEKLEKYILNELPSKMELDPERVQKDYRLRLSYSRSETIKLDSIEEFRGEIFKDGLEQVRLSLGAYTFSLTFNIKNIFSQIELYTPGDNRSEAEERANSIISDVEDILRGSEKKSMAVLYHPWLSTPTFIGIGVGLSSSTFIIDVVLGELTKKLESLALFLLSSLSLGLFFLLLGSLVSLLRRYHPYTWFESNKTKRLQTIDRILFRVMPITLVGGLIVTVIVRLLFL